MQRRAVASSSSAAAAEASAAPTAPAPQTPLRRKRRKRKPANSGMQDIMFNILAVFGFVVLVAAALWGFFRVASWMASFTESSLLHHHSHDESGPIPWNPLYRVPESMDVVGDRSDEYVRLRQEVDSILPPHPERSLQRMQDFQRTVQGMPIPVSHHSDQVHEEEEMIEYDIYNCPDLPPPGYPYAWKLVDEVLEHWPANDATLRDTIHQGLCVFDYQKDYDRALSYRNAELPFVVINDPSVAQTVERWNHPSYMERMLGTVPHRCEYSKDNHFMYYVPPSKKKRKKNNVAAPKGWQEPTKMSRMPYPEWLQHANVTDETLLGPDHPHWYYRLIGCGLMQKGHCDKDSSEYLFDELTFFQPRESLYIVEPEEQKGIHCRFGMKGVIAENHFDGSRNAIVVLGGSRRYILAHPNQCPHLALLPKGHPSARHSAVDWTHPDLQEFPQFAQARANEVVLQPGHVLYLPTDWFHFIVSLELNFQCNTRSGITKDYMESLQQCGF